MGIERHVTLAHSELIGAVQQAMVDQLRRDGRLRSDMELGLVFYSESADDICVRGTVRRLGRVVYELQGARAQLAAVATQLALQKLSPDHRRAIVPGAQVRWRAVRFLAGTEEMERFMVDVHFQTRA